MTLILTLDDWDVLMSIQVDSKECVYTWEWIEETTIPIWSRDEKAEV